MKSKVYFLLLALTSLTGLLKAQKNVDNLPARTVVEPYKLNIGFYTTTVLIFPSPVLVGDRGFNEIITAKEKDLANVLKIKAARKNFNPTNLHVFTTDGRIYSFEISFSRYPSVFTFDLAKLDGRDSTSLRSANILFSGDKINNIQLEKELNQVKTKKPFIAKTVHKFGMKLKLQSIYSSGSRLFFGFEICNKSNMRYDIDFTRTYIQDEQKAKRSSFQEREIIPFYKDSLPTVSGRAKSEFVIGLPKFTLSDNKDFLIELFEKNGGRNLSMKIKNRQLLRSRNLLTQDR